MLHGNRMSLSLRLGDMEVTVDLDNNNATWNKEERNPTARNRVTSLKKQWSLKSKSVNKSHDSEILFMDIVLSFVFL